MSFLIVDEAGHVKAFFAVARRRPSRSRPRSGIRRWCSNAATCWPALPKPCTATRVFFGFHFRRFFSSSLMQ